VNTDRANGLLLRLEQRTPNQDVTLLAHIRNGVWPGSGPGLAPDVGPGDYAPVSAGSGTDVIWPAELVASRAAYHVPAGIVSWSVPLVGCWPRSTV
jgi:hypothetical protein